MFYGFRRDFDFYLDLFQAKFEKSRYIRSVPQYMPPNHRPEIRSHEYAGLPMKPACSDSARALNTKTIPEAPSDSFVQKKDNCQEIASRSSCCRHGSTKEGTGLNLVPQLEWLLFEIRDRWLLLCFIIFMDCSLLRDFVVLLLTIDCSTHMHFIRNTVFNVYLPPIAFPLRY